MRLKIIKADSGQLLWEFVLGAAESEPGDPFYQWLHDDHALRIDWSTFGIKQLKPE